MNPLKLIYSTILAAMLVGCSSDGPEKVETYYNPIVLSESSTRTNDAVASFSYRLFERQAATTSDNFILSPFSVSAVLSMLANGADDSKCREILEVLGVGSVEEANSYYRQLIHELPSHTNEVDIRIANSLWTPPEMSVGEGFSSVMRDVYDAECLHTVGDGNANASLLNSWVSKKTGGLIPGLVEELGDVALANALYLRGEWTEKFDSDKTEPAPFYNIDGTSGEVVMMSKEGYYGVVDEDVSMVSLDLGRGYEACFLTSVSKTLEEISAWLDEDSFSRLYSGLAYINGTLRLPKFRTEYKSDLAGLLDSMCDGDLWSGTDSYPLIAQGISFNRVVHGCVYEINESGVTAAAATVITGDIALGPGASMTFDHPFIFIIRSKSGPILFMGQKTRA